jgi:hypothetical protein
MAVYDEYVKQQGTGEEGGEAPKEEKAETKA